jgi:pyruvate kinase
MHAPGQRKAPVLSLTPNRAIARRLALAGGVHSVHLGSVVKDVDEMVSTARATAQAEGYASRGDAIVIAAGMPFGKAGTTNLLHVAQV